MFITKSLNSEELKVKQWCAGSGLGVLPLGGRQLENSYLLKWTTYISAILEVDERLFPGDNRNRNSGPNKHTISATKWVVLKFPCSGVISPSVVCIGSSNQSIHAMKWGCWRKSQKGDASPSRDSCVLCLCYSVCQRPCLVFSHDPCLVHKVLSRLTWPVRIEVRLLV